MGVIIIYKKFRKWIALLTTIVVIAEIFIMSVFNHYLGLMITYGNYGDRDSFFSNNLGMLQMLMHIFTLAIVVFTITVAVGISYLLSKSEK